MNILLYCNAFLPKSDGIVYRIKTFLDVVNSNYPNIKVILLTPYSRSIKQYKRFKVYKISSVNFKSWVKDGPDIEVANLIHCIKDFKIVKKICIDNKIDIINIYHGDTFNMLLHQISKLLNIPLVINYHANIHLYLKSYNIGFFKKEVYTFFHYYTMKLNDCDLVLNVSKVNEQHLIKNNYLSIKQRRNIIPKIVDTKKFYPTNIKKTNSRLKLLLVSRIEKEKNMDIVFKALHRIKNCELHVVGDGNYLKNLKKLYKKNIIYHGKVKNNILYKYYSMADIFINPSKTETLGFTTLEAMACKCPVIGFNKLGTKEIIKCRHNGLLFNNINELIDCVDLIRKNNKFKRKIIKNAYNYAKMLKPKKSVDKIISILKREIKIKKNKKEELINKNFFYLYRIIFTIMFFIGDFCNKLFPK